MRARSAPCESGRAGAGHFRLTLGDWHPIIPRMASKPVPPLPRLGELELAVLEHLWQVREADVAETHAAIGMRRGIMPNTVGSALERLHRKNLVLRRKVSHAYRYQAALDRDAFRARKLVEAAGGVRALAGEGLLSAFVDLVADTDAQALEHLEQLVEQRRKQGRKERPR
jgi:predicted transcriptional regulator